MDTQTMTAPAHKGKPRVEREARLAWVPLSLMRVSQQAQRDYNPSWAAKIAADMELEQLGYPYVSHRDGYWWIIDGQHRFEAYKIWDEDWESQQIQCFTYEGLDEQQEAEMFLKLNNKLSVSTFEKFKVGLRAGRPEEVAIDSIVRHAGLKIGKKRAGLTISAVGTLRKVFNHLGGTGTLTRTLCIIRDAYGQEGLEAPVIEGIALVVHRYGDMLDDERIIGALKFAAAGVSGLLNTAEVTHRSTGHSKAACVAAAAVDLIRARRGGKRIPKWWRTSENGAASAS